MQKFFIFLLTLYLCICLYTHIAWGFHTPREIPDPYETKPKDWVDEEMIIDPNDVKPEGWDDTPAEIPDPKATKPGIHLCVFIYLYIYQFVYICIYLCIYNRIYIYIYICFYI